MGDRVEALLSGDLLQVVDDEGHRLVHGLDRGRQQRGDRDGGGGRTQAAEHGRSEGLDAIEGGGEVRQQDRRVVVVLVDRDPSDPGSVPLGPLGQERRLAVAGRGDHGQDHRCLGGGEPVHQRGPCDDPRTRPRAGSTSTPTGRTRRSPWDHPLVVRSWLARPGPRRHATKRRADGVNVW